MAKFATKSPGALSTTGETLSTHESGDGFARDPKSELYLTAVSTKLESTFYENVDEREARLVRLVRVVTNEDPEWVLRFITWLRAEANMRSVSILVAGEFVKARLDAGLSGMSRQAVAAACLRADEPGEFIAYWQTRHGRNLPMPVKRGVADAATKSYNQRSALRYDGGSGAMRLGDVVELTHPTPKTPEQSALFGWLLDRRHGRRETPEADLAMLKQVTARLELNELPIAERHAFARQVLAGEPDAEFRWLQALAGQWEWGKSWLGQDTEDTTFDRVPEGEQWKMFVQHGMGYMAMLRNLRNFDEAKISDDVFKHVAGVLADVEEVKRSRQFPFRFYSAFKATGGGRWSKALGAGLEHSLANVPSLGGNTLILADMSGSMWPYGRVDRGTVFNCELAALFGSALALRAERSTLVQYGTGSAEVVVERGKSVMSHLEKFTNQGGTDTVGALRTHFRPDEHNRVVVITDEQMSSRGGGFGSVIPDNVHMFTWNLGGYAPAHVEASETRHTFAGLTDQSWGLIPRIEIGAKQDWPF